MDKTLELKKMERDLIDDEVALMLLKFTQEVLDELVYNRSAPDVDKWSRKIVAHLREHLV